MIVDGRRILLRLQPLRVPAGWTVRHNSFVEVEPADLTDDEKCHVLHEDLLLLQSDFRKVAIDLGWYGDWATGCFRLEMCTMSDGKPDYNSIHQRYTSNSTREIARQLDAWLE
jgi:hypothetical protein